MARLGAHGREVGTLYFTTSARRYMSDGVILRNTGLGWKIAGRCRPSSDPAAAFRAAQQAQREKLAGQPALMAYRAWLHQIAGLSKRSRLHTAVGLMPDDPDGVWSSACGGGPIDCSANLGEVVELCRLYRALLKEQATQRGRVARSAEAGLGR
jgi:hypothetical protein